MVSPLLASPTPEGNLICNPPSPHIHSSYYHYDIDIENVDNGKKFQACISSLTF